MGIFRTSPVVLALLASNLVVTAEVASQQPAPSQPSIEVSVDLPPPVGEEMRVGKKIHPKAGEKPAAAR